MKLGQFSDEAIQKARLLTADKMNFSEDETEILDFGRCQRPDGSYYGTSGQCRKGKEVDAKQIDEEKLKGATFDQLSRLSQAGQLDAETRAPIKEELEKRKESSLVMKTFASTGLNPDYEIPDEVANDISDFYVSVNKAVLEKAYKGNKDQAKVDYLVATGRDLWGDYDDKYENNANGERYQKAYSEEFNRQHKARYGSNPSKSVSKLDGNALDWYDHLGWNDGQNPEDIAFD